MSLRISVFTSKELQATILLLKGMDREMAKQVRKAIKSVSESEWRDEVRGNLSTRFETRVLGDTARVAVSDQNITLKSAGVGKALSGGLKPSELVHAAEFGANRNVVQTYKATSRKGKSYTVHKRHTRAQLRPRNLKGYVVYPAAARIIPRMAALYAQTAVRTFYELIEGRSK